MSLPEITKIGKRGTIVIPAELRRRFDLKEGSQVIVEEREDGLSVRPAVTLPVEIYSPERKAEFLLEQRSQQGRLPLGGPRGTADGVDPRKIIHKKPPGA